MSVLDKMLQVREGLIQNDRDYAVGALTRKLYYEAAPHVNAGERFTLFPCRSKVIEYCDNNQVDIRAMDWLLDAMRKEHLIEDRDMPIILTSHAVEELC